jgi:hypothetical protein
MGCVVLTFSVEFFYQTIVVPRRVTIFENIKF